MIAALVSAGPASAAQSFPAAAQPAQKQYCHHKPNKPHQHCGDKPAPASGTAPATGSGTAPATGSGIAPAAAGEAPGAGEAPATGAAAPGAGTAPFNAGNGGRSLPFTGLDLLLLVLLGIALVALGAFLRVGERLRRRLAPARHRA